MIRCCCFTHLVSYVNLGHKNSRNSCCKCTIFNDGNVHCGFYVFPVALFWLIPLPLPYPSAPPPPPMVYGIGSLSDKDGDGYERVPEKVNSRYFKLYRAYSTSFNSSNVGECYWIWILKDSIRWKEKKKKVVPLCSRPPENHAQFHVVVVHWRQRDVQKRVMFFLLPI